MAVDNPVYDLVSVKKDEGFVATATTALQLSLIHIYNVAFTKTTVENEKLKEKNRTLSASLDKAKEGSVFKRLEDAKLRQDYEAALKTLDSIPPEVIRFYENRTQEPVVHHDK